MLPEKYLTDQDAAEEFKRILSEKPRWKRLVGSQIAEFISRQVSWPLRAAQWRFERAEQEIHLSTALDRASILAGAEDRQYVPIKPTPSYGDAVFLNRGDTDVLIQACTSWVSEDQLTYEVCEPVNVPAGESAIAGVKQLDTLIEYHTITEEKPYFEIRLKKETSVKVSSMSIDVDNGFGYQRWSLYPRLLNAGENTLAYDEFYTSLDELGIRFGNGTSGKIPKVNASVKVIIKLSSGETELIQGQKLTYLNGSTDLNIGLIAAKTYSPIVGGRSREGIESIRKNALYNVLYDDDVVWSADYEFLIKRKWPELLFVNVWGEQEQEKIHGISFDWINKIFISAYSADRPDIEQLIAGELKDPINRRYVPVPVNIKYYTLVIDGVIPRTESKTVVSDKINELLTVNYTLDSPFRLSKVRLHDVYKLLNKTGYFELCEASLNIEIHGDITSNELNDLVCLDLDTSVISIEYN